MANRTFIDLLSSGEPQIGTLVSMSSPDALDVLCRCGFSWLFLDLEHSTMSVDDAKLLLQVAAGRVLMIARIAVNDPVEIKKALDIGCDGLIVPMVNSRAEAEAAVRAAKYPPDGERSVGVGRAHGYGTEFKVYVDRANREVAIIVQIEHEKAVANVDEILSVPGVDAILIGPYDLSGSMGLLGQVGHERVQEAIGKVRSRCLEAGMPYGLFGMTAEVCAKEIAAGARFVIVGVDMIHLYHGARAQIEEIESMKEKKVGS